MKTKQSKIVVKQSRFADPQGKHTYEVIKLVNRIAPCIGYNASQSDMNLYLGLENTIVEVIKK